MLTYSQEQLAALGLQPANIQKVLSARNTPIPGGMMKAGGVNVLVEPSGQFTSQDQLGGVVIARTDVDGSPVYLRSVDRCPARLSEPAALPEFLQLARRRGHWQR